MANTSPRGSLSHRIANLGNPSSPPSTFLFLIASLSATCSPLPCPTRATRRTPIRRGLPYVLYSLRSTCIHHEDHQRSDIHPRGCSRCNSASEATYRTMRRALHSFLFALCSKTCRFSLFYTIVPILVVSSLVFRLVFRLVVFIRCL